MPDYFNRSGPVSKDSFLRKFKNPSALTALCHHALPKFRSTLGRRLQRIAQVGSNPSGIGFSAALSERP